MTKQTYEEIKTLLEELEELTRKEIMLTPPADEIYLSEQKNSNVSCFPRVEKEKLNSDEIEVLRKFISKKIKEIEERLKELGYYD